MFFASKSFSQDSSKENSQSTSSSEILYAKDFASYEVTDGDTIVFIRGKGNRERIRLEGIDAPEMKQPCLTEGKACGELSKSYLKSLTSSDLYCEISGRDKYKRGLGTCFSKGINLNKVMVKQGYAVAYVYYTKIYEEDEREAKRSKKGLWKYGFKNPSQFRKEKKNTVQS